MGRPTDWHVLDLDRDPVPGDPYEVKELARKLGDFADDVGSALRSVRGLDGDSAVQGWMGLSGDAYRQQFGDLPSELDKLEGSYRLASGALDGYWPQLETAQADADRALAHGRTAKADLDAATTQLGTADAWVKRAQDKSTEYQADPKPGVPPPSEADVRAATRSAADASSAHSSASSAVHDAQQRLDAAKELAAQAAGVPDRPRIPPTTPCMKPLTRVSRTSTGGRGPLITNGLNARRRFLVAHDITVIGGADARRIATDPAFRGIFDKVIKQGHSRGDATLVAFAHVTGIEAVTMERRLSNVVIHTLKFPNLIRRVI